MHKTSYFQALETWKLKKKKAPILYHLKEKKKKIRLMVEDSFASTPSSGHIWKCPMVDGSGTGAVFVECKLNTILLFLCVKTKRAGGCAPYTVPQF